MLTTAVQYRFEKKLSRYLPVMQFLAERVFITFGVLTIMNICLFNLDLPNFIALIASTLIVVGSFYFIVLTDSIPILLKPITEILNLPFDEIRARKKRSLESFKDYSDALMIMQLDRKSVV